MFLTTPSLEELKQSEMSVLIDMLARQTTEYTDLFKKEGVTLTTTAIREMIVNIQVAIDYKMSEEKN